MTPSLPPDLTLPPPAYFDGYLKALEDYAVCDVLKAIEGTNPNISAAEAGQIAALLIEQLPKAIHPELTHQYLNILRSTDLSPVSIPISWEAPQLMSGPAESKLPSPQYQIGDKIRLIPIEGATEWGTLTGLYWSYATHRCRWMYRYLLCLAPDSPSAGWIKLTQAWENEIEGHGSSTP